jgi:hypothetical protein
MKRSNLVPLLVLITVTPAAVAAEFSPTVEVRPPAARAPAIRVMSPEVSAMFAISAPKFTPPPLAALIPTVDTTEPDKPRTGIIRLPQYFVEEQKIPAFTYRELLTNEGGVDLAYKRHTGLRIGAIGPNKNDFWAKALLEEEMGAERAKEMFELTRFAPEIKSPSIFLGRPLFETPLPAAGPWNGLVVPWERK